jgi:hypothetical protein
LTALKLKESSIFLSSSCEPIADMETLIFYSPPGLRK